jgi:Phosphoesterase family
VFANSEESTTGHKITAGGYANDYTQRYINAKRGRKGNPDIFAIGIPPNAFVFDQAVRQGVPFHVYGELGAGNQPFANDGRPTYQGVLDNTDPSYPSQVQGTCRPFGQTPNLPNSARCTADAGTVGTTTGPPNSQSRINVFQSEFQQQLAAGTVPRFNYLILFNDHTDGTTPGTYTPKANVADNDLALGQLVQLVSQSPIWAQSAIFVMEDDSQDGIDSVDAHRIPALVISPWAKRGGVTISTRYDHYSFLRTAEMIAGLSPLSLNDALATPLYDAFISGAEQPDVEGTRFTAIQPAQSMTETNPANAPGAAMSKALPWDKVDAVPQRLSDELIWQSVFGAGSVAPPAGRNHSAEERARATGAMRLLRQGRSPRAFLLKGGH